MNHLLKPPLGLTTGEIMKLTPFGETVRVLRMKYGLSLKMMAEAMGISSAYLSSIEFGEKRLAQKHIDSAIAFLADKVSDEQLKQVRDAAEQSKRIIGLPPVLRTVALAL